MVPPFVGTEETPLIFSHKVSSSGSPSLGNWQSLRWSLSRPKLVQFSSGATRVALFSGT